MLSYKFDSIDDLILNFNNLFRDHWLLGLLFTALMIVANWLVLEKAGERGWKQFIPIYNHYIEYKLYWSTNAFWFAFFSPLILLSIVFIAAFINGTLASFVLIVLVVIIVIYLALFSIVLEFKKAKCFAQEFWFGFGLIFLNPIFKCILAFDKKCYYSRY
ncbi:MAG: DUF5684 domain-containing protein [Erysipelotrichaceae bacterium]|nr:DUF5684 domain-containing protein [Erysipelotrichaceae bacterium]